jgi:hypothetical protein
MSTDVRAVGWYQNEIQAEIAKGRLEEAGIAVVLFHDTGGVLLPWTTIRLLVREEDFERAREVLSAPAAEVPPSGRGGHER